MWAWQTKTYKKGEDPINEWKKRRESGVISDLEDQVSKFRGNIKRFLSILFIQLTYSYFVLVA